MVSADAGLKAMIEHHSLFYRDLVQPVELFGTAKRDTELKRYWAYAITRIRQVSRQKRRMPIPASCGAARR